MLLAAVMKSEEDEVPSTPAEVTEAIWTALQSDPATADPMNALLLWTELGKGLAGTLERKGADLGLLRRTVLAHCGPAPEATVLARWFYRVEPERRLARETVAASLARIEQAIEKASAPLAHQSTGGEGQRNLFMAIVAGWFPVGPSILRCLPEGARATEQQVLAALGGWCSKYLPEDPSGARDLGVRVTRGGDAGEEHPARLAAAVPTAADGSRS